MRIYLVENISRDRCELFKYLLKIYRVYIFIFIQFFANLNFFLLIATWNNYEKTEILRLILELSFRDSLSDVLEEKWGDYRS